MTRARYFLVLYRIFRHNQSPLRSATLAMREVVKPLAF